MSKEAKDELDRAMDEVLRAQRVCAWCEQRFESGDELVDHIIEHHDKENRT